MFTWGCDAELYIQKICLKRNGNKKKWSILHLCSQFDYATSKTWIIFLSFIRQWTLSNFLIAPYDTIIFSPVGSTFRNVCKSFLLCQLPQIVTTLTQAHMTLFHFNYWNINALSDQHRYVKIIFFKLNLFFFFYKVSTSQEPRLWWNVVPQTATFPDSPFSDGLPG